MVLELNQVVISGEEHTFSMIAPSGKLTVITGGNAERRRRLFQAILGFVPVLQGYVSIDGEPLSASTVSEFRQLFSYAPPLLPPVGEVHPYKPPTVQEVFNLRANRSVAISNGILAEEMKRLSPADDCDPEQVRLLAVATLLCRPVLLASSPPPSAASHLCSYARHGRVVVAESDDQLFIDGCDQIVELT